MRNISHCILSIHQLTNKILYAFSVRNLEKYLYTRISVKFEKKMTLM